MFLCCSISGNAIQNESSLALLPVTCPGAMSVAGGSIETTPSIRFLGPYRKATSQDHILMNGVPVAVRIQEGNPRQILAAGVLLDPWGHEYGFNLPQKPNISK